MAQRKIISTSQPSILALKNIVSKVKNQICMRSLTIAIRQHCLEEQQTHLKDNYLRFFLQCERQLKRNTTAQWNKVIHLQIKKTIGCENLFGFFRLKLTRETFRKIHSYAQLDELIKIEEKICEEFDDLKDMEISQDVKVKTKYFFKWCQFISEKNQIKQMKNKQIEDIKKSKIFNQYSSKFSSFIKWKQYIRRIKYVKSKAVELQIKAKNRILQEIFVQIKQKIQIISIEKMLEVAVGNKLRNLTLKSVFSKLNQNKLKENSFKQQLKKKGNIWLFRFYGQLKKRGGALFNKSSVQNRQQVEYQYQQLCKLTCWKGLKMKMKQTKQKVGLILFSFKKSGFTQFIKQCSSKRHIFRKKREFKFFCKGYSFRSFIQAVKLNVQNKNYQVDQIKSVNDSIKKTRFNLIKNNIYQKRNEGQKFQQQLFEMKNKIQKFEKRLFVQNLRNIKKNQVYFSEKISSLKLYIAMKLFQNRQKSYKLWQRQTKQLMTQLGAKHKHIIMKRSLKGLKSYKKVKIEEIDAFNNIFSLIDLKMKYEALVYLKQRTQNMKKIQKLMKASQYVTLKVSFITILNKMLSKKMKIKSFCTKKDIQLKRKLFELLVSNSQYLHDATSRAHQYFIIYTKKVLFNNLSQRKNQVTKQNQAVKMLQQAKMSLLFKRFKQRNEKRKQFEQSAQIISNLFKASRFQAFFESAKQLEAQRRQQEKKILKIQKCIVKGSIRRMREFLKDKKNRYSKEYQLNTHYSYLIQEIHLGLATKTLKYMLRKAQISLNKKQELLKTQRKKHFLRQFAFNKNNKILKKQLRTLRSVQITNILVDKNCQREKSQLLKDYLTDQRQTKGFKIFSYNVLTDLQERQMKEAQLVRFLQDGRLRQSKQILIDRIKKHHELGQNSSILYNRIAAQCFKHFINGYFKIKSQQLKELSALKHYASNVKRRGIRALKYSINMSLLKQNRAKTQHYSKILMQKSMDNARKKSKLMQTIQRYNMSRVSRVLR